MGKERPKEVVAEIPSILVLEPAAEQRKRRAAGVEVRKEFQPDLESIKTHLKEIRHHSRDNHSVLLEELQRSLGQYAGLKLAIASDVKQAASYIKEIAGGTDLASINKSNVVINEIRPELEASGFKTYIRYFTEFKNIDKFERKVEDYWALPGLHERGLVESFDIAKTVTQLNSSEVRDYLAILGVNAISAEDGFAFFLQHMSNISKDLQQARKIVLVVSLEKVVQDREAASFQTRSMGIFGLESVLLDLGPKEIEGYDFESLPILAGGQDRELHVLILDNGRGGLVSGGYQDLFLCIDCRACARQCPIGLHLVKKGWVYSPKNYLFGFLQGWLPPTEACFHCGRCQVECPVDIDIPTLIWRAQLEHYVRHGRTWKKRLLDNPELLAKLGSLTAPLSNWAKDNSLLKPIMETLVGLHRKAQLPAFHRQTLRKLIKGGSRG
ncbi:MAG: hypothetical protein JSW32_00820 [Deltaproteobacteria bacterium]|nr:MAG: hypothetical protein JSW32_00820 [Deltaproteobacteria bacterium]